MIQKPLLLFNGFSKWMSGVLCTLLVMAVVSLIQMGRAIGELQIRYEHQDSAIEELTRQYAEATRRLRILERREGN